MRALSDNVGAPPEVSMMSSLAVCECAVDPSTDKDEPPVDDTDVTSTYEPLVDADSDGSSPPEDCDDGDPTVHPGAPEECNGEDDDCDGLFDGATS